MPDSKSIIDGVKKGSIVMSEFESRVTTSDEFAGKFLVVEINNFHLRDLVNVTYDTKECHTIAIEPNRSLCNTTDMAPHHRHCGNNFRRLVLVETHLEVECACADAVHPIFDMECRLM